jgi:endonuclease/exonuclease/phosphatase family metal-dependent hydrolase
VVVSWNVHIGAGRLSDLVHLVRAGAFSGGRPPSGFILLLQEALRTGSTNDVVALAKQEAVSLLYVPSLPNAEGEGPGRGDRGNAIVSTFSLAAPTAIELPFIRQRRVAVAATVFIDGTEGRVPLRLASVHLDASTNPRQLFLVTAAQRERQAESLVDLLDDDPARILVGSDLNTWAGGPREPAFLAMRRWLPDVSVGAPYSHRFPLDYLFRRLPPSWTFEAEPVEDLFGSDHRPIVARIRIAS